MENSAPYALKRRRTIIACSHCRKRKIRCITTEQPPKNPCARCTKRNLACEYVAAPDQELNSTAQTTPHLPPNSLESDTDSSPSQTPMTWAPPLTAPDFSRCPSAEPWLAHTAWHHPSQPPPRYSRPTSSVSTRDFHPLYPTPPLTEWLQPHTPSLPDSCHMSPGPTPGNCAPAYDDGDRLSYLTLPSLPPPPRNRVYDLQAGHARHYLTARQSQPKPCQGELGLIAQNPSAYLDDYIEMQAFEDILTQYGDQSPDSASA
ncbi:hypothetical protein DFH09DRAFT_1175059 [Mycena vulgaris]|nr:hypothetical protein DFH09DRAFT_1175059 [Mycena vulgaris]